MEKALQKIAPPRMQNQDIQQQTTYHNAAANSLAIPPPDPEDPQRVPSDRALGLLSGTVGNVIGSGAQLGFDMGENEGEPPQQQDQ